MRISAGLLMYRIKEGILQVFLVHPGGPFWKNKDTGAWSIPKGEINKGEGLISGAKREFFEETGIKAHGRFIPLGTVSRPGKIVHAWAFRGNFSGFLTRRQMVTIEFKGRKFKVLEIDKAQFFPLKTAKEKIVKYQKELLDELEKKIKD